MTSAELEPSAECTLRGILGGLPDEDLDRVSAWCAGVTDWPALLAASREHGVGGVLLAGLRRANIAGPRDAVESHERLLFVESMRQDVMRQTLEDVLAALARHGVANVALKGPLLASRLYDAAVVRPSTDLDVLVAPSSLDATVLALGPLGYSLEGGARGRFFREHHHHVHIVHRVLPVIELHLEAYRGFGTSLPAGPLVERAVPSGVPGFAAARVLSPEDEWLYLAVHGASHRFDRLSWLYDLKVFCRAYPALRWDVVAARARERRLEAVVALASRLLKDWLGMDVRDHGHLARLGNARARAAQHFAKPRVGHLANAAASFAFDALLCDPRAVAAFGARYLRTKVLHELPLRGRERLVS